MPFTLSHAAAVLPLRRTRLIWSALLLGSFGPDFQYFVLMSYHSRSWHYYPDILRFCFPFTLAAFLLFQGFLKRPLGEILPVRLQRRLDFNSSYIPRSVVEWFWVVLSLALGIATHTAWDAMTHPYTIPYRNVAWLRSTVRVPFLDHTYGYEVAQFFSTIVGLLILLAAFVLWYRRTPAAHPAISRLSRRAKTGIALAAVIVTTIGAVGRAIQIAGPVDKAQVRTNFFHVVLVISSIGWLMWEALIFGIIRQLAYAREKKRGTQS